MSREQYIALGLHHKILPGNTNPEITADTQSAVNPFVRTLRYINDRGEEVSECTPRVSEYEKLDNIFDTAAQLEEEAYQIELNEIELSRMGTHTMRISNQPIRKRSDVLREHSKVLFDHIDQKLEE